LAGPDRVDSRRAFGLNIDAPKRGVFLGNANKLRPGHRQAGRGFSLRGGGRYCALAFVIFLEAVMTNRIKASCADCGMDTLRGDNWYMVQNHIWHSVWPGSKTANAALGSGDDQNMPFSEILCLECLKKRLGRDLRPDDFTDDPVNDAVRNRFFK
jgi:hypothetical protein